MGLHYSAFQGPFRIGVEDAYECFGRNEGHFLLVLLDVFAIWARQGVGWYVGLSGYVNDFEVIVL